MSKGSKVVSGACSAKPVLTFTQEAWEKMWLLTRSAKEKTKSFECTSFGIMDPEDNCKVIDIWVPEQINSGASTIADEDSVLEWMMEMRASGVDMGQLTFWQHSHADMNVFFSSTDLNTINRLECDNIQWSVVTNMDGEITVRADIFRPVRFWWANCDYEIDYPAIAGLEEWASKQQGKMTFETPIPKKWHSGKTGKFKGVPATPIHNIADDEHAYDGTHFSWEAGWGRYSGSALLDSDLGDAEVTHYDMNEPMVSENSSDRPSLCFTHAGIQDAYDDALISVKEAETLEHSLCLGAKTSEDIDEELAILVRHSAND